MKKTALWLGLSFLLVAALVLTGCPPPQEVVESDIQIVGFPLEFTYVPAYGSFENLKGQVWHVKPADHAVAVYIYIWGGWWTKPCVSAPLTPIRDDGSWQGDITTAEFDERATKIVAYLIPKDYTPPLMSGEPELPAELDEYSLAKVQISRQPMGYYAWHHSHNWRGLPRAISFSGYNWRVRYLGYSKPPTGPGPNYWSDSNENVWVDEQGRLHLRITERNGRWYSSQVISEKSFGYGKYIFYLASRVDNLNENVVLGLFTWSNRPLYNHREMDIEFARWGVPANENTQFVVQPWHQPGNMVRFTIGDYCYSTHIFKWGRESIFFQSLRGHHATPPSDDYIIAQWTYTGEDIPVPGDENVMINLWLFKGNSPTDGREVEVVIERFEFIPYGER